MSYERWIAGVFSCLAVAGCSAGDDEAQGSADNGGRPEGGGGSTGSALDDGTSFGTGGGTASTGGSFGIGPGYGGASSGGSTGAGGSTAGLPAEEPAASEEVVANPFTIVAHDPLSTFAADVDTASYDLFLRDVGQGVLPRPETVRIEELVNYFTYDYVPPAPDATDPFSISLAAAPNLFADGTMTLRIGIQGKAAPAFEKKPTNLVYLIDVSGSMQEPLKLPLVKHTVLESLDVLSPTDRVSIVTYAGSAGLALPPTVASDRAAIQSAVAGLEAGGSTNGAGGIQLAYQQAEQGFIDGGINHVVLCTDGDFNVGVSSTSGLIDLIEQKRRSGITLTALGFGATGINDAMMEAVSNAGNGMYGVITSQEQASRYVEERLLSTLTLIAKDMKIQVEFNPAEVYAYRLLGYENRAIADQDFRNDVVDAGEVGAGHRVTALYQLVLTGGMLPSAAGTVPTVDGDAYDGPIEVPGTDVVLVKVRYKDVDAIETDPAYEVSASLAPEELAASIQTANVDFQWAAAVAAFAEILRGSPYATPSAIGNIGSVLEARAGTDPDRNQFLEAFRTARRML